MIRRRLEGLWRWRDGEDASLLWDPGIFVYFFCLLGLMMSCTEKPSFKKIHFFISSLCLWIAGCLLFWDAFVASSSSLSCLFRVLEMLLMLIRLIALWTYFACPMMFYWGLYVALNFSSSSDFLLICCLECWLKCDACFCELPLECGTCPMMYFTEGLGLVGSVCVGYVWIDFWCSRPRFCWMARFIGLTGFIWIGFWLMA